MKPKKFFYLLILPLSFLQFSGSYMAGDTYKGKCSYYGNKFHGRPTASGERYNMYAETAAHKELDFQSIVEVTNLKNGKKTTVRINDRGPFKPGRILDLSVTSAKKIDMVRDGVVDIEMKVLRVGEHGPEVKPEDEAKPPSPRPTEELTEEELKRGRKEVSVEEINKKRKYLTRTYNLYGVPKKPRKYGIQIGSYGELRNAVDAGKRAARAGTKNIFVQASWTSSKKRIFRVLVGNSAPVILKRYVPRLKKLGFSGAFIKQHHLG